jgi:hypothetical protein
MENKDKVITMLKEAYLKEEGQELEHEKAVDMCNKMYFFADVIYDDWIESLESE